MAYFKSIFELTDTDRVQYAKIYESLIKRYGATETWHERLLSNLSRLPGHTGKQAHTRFNGQLIVVLTELELSVVLYKGWQHYGGRVDINDKGVFSGKFYD